MEEGWTDCDHVFVWNSHISDLKTRSRTVVVSRSKTSSGSGFYGLTGMFSPRNVYTLVLFTLQKVCIRFSALS